MDTDPLAGESRGPNTTSTSTDLRIEKDEAKAKQKMLDLFSDYHPDIVHALKYTSHIFPHRNLN